MSAPLGERYLSFPELVEACEQLTEANPEWVSLEVVGESRHGRPLLLLSLGANDGRREERPGFWLDGGTHAAEWAGVMAAVVAVARWSEALAAGEPEAVRWFSRHSVYVMPCVSPDGYQALVEGQPFLRSTLRPPPDGQPRVGLDPQDIDGDGHVRWMRWRHPAGTHVQDEEVPLFMRPRRLSDDPADAFFYCSEGALLSWDGETWIQAPRAYGLDLNRNFPAHWAPFSMFGMDGGQFPLSEPESRAMVDAFVARPFIGAALTNHTYTGCLLTQPYRQDTPLSDADVDLMEDLARDATRGTPYKVYKVSPEFTYDPKKSIVGVWSDALATTFGVPGYTLELWDPYAYTGQEISDPARFFRRPDEAVIRGVLRALSEQPGAVSPWRPFDHPQLGAVELGGIDYMRTIRNPPVALLGEECDRAFRVADAMRRALPRVEARAAVIASEGALRCVELVLENMGMLPTSALRRAEELKVCLGVSARLTISEGLALVDGAPERPLSHLDGWGSATGGMASNAIYPALPARGSRAVARWWVRGSGQVSITWQGGRGGRGVVEVTII